MKLSSVTLSSVGSTEELVLGVAEYGSNCPYLVKGIVGIDAEDIVPKFYARGLQSDKKFYEYTMKPRDVVIRIGLNPIFRINEDVSSIRDNVYRLISADRSGLLQIQFNSY